jgi:NADP-dependent 3-hydroxy acid dehydrogenase YdfG
MPTPTALITGASSGIGRAIALRLAEKGYRLALCARRTDRLEDLATSLAGKTEVLTQAVDLRQETDILAWFEQVDRTWGQIDVLVNNAGLGHKAPLITGQTADWEDMLTVNVLALCICSREALKRMQPQNAGHIVHLGSMSGHRVSGGGMAMYSATKFAVRSLLEGLRQELRAVNSAVRVSAISPGFVETEFAEKFHQDVAKAAETYSRFPVLQAEDIAEAVCYVLTQPEHVQIHDVLLRPTQQVT